MTETIEPMGDVYRLYASDGALLYVGQTINLEARLRHHRRVQPWWHEVVTVERSRHPVSLLASVEARTIQAHRPRYNRQHGSGDLSGDPIQIRYPERVLAAIDERAAAQGISRAELLRQIAARYIEETT